MPRSRHRGGGLPLLLAALALALVSAGALALSSSSTAQHRLRATERALAQAREALLAHAADRPIDARVGPGYLPCPDLDDDGWAEATCGSLAGHLGQDERLGRLPWKTLGLPDLRDGHGERLWYAVSTRYKGLLNCAASRACIDMTPSTALGTITVRDSAGHLLHDGTIAERAGAASGGAAAVILAPGPPIGRRDGHEQRRGCEPGLCDARGRCVAQPPRRAARCDPVNYLDASALEDNAGFHDRSDAAGRAANRDGFIHGPVIVAGRLEVNDRIAAISYGEVMARVMARVAIEVAHCLRPDAGAMPESPCPASPALGRVPDAALSAGSCAASLEDPGWWRAWRAHVLQAGAADPGLELVDTEGRRLGERRRFAVVVTREAGSCATDLLQCDASGCARAIQPPRRAANHDALAAYP
jgi:hypothetical protein